MRRESDTDWSFLPTVEQGEEGASRERLTMQEGQWREVLHCKKQKQKKRRESRFISSAQLT